MEKSNKTGIFVMLIVMFIAGLTIASHSSDASVKQGMSVRLALDIAKDSIHSTTAIKHEHIRMGDTLEFLGIRDDFQTDALRRYLVRNTDVGVKRIWRYDADRKVAFNYAISESDLTSLDNSKTVGDLVKIISEKSGIYVMTPFDATTLVSACRKKYKSLSVLSAPLTTPVNTEVNVNTNKFVTCVTLFESPSAKEAVTASIRRPQGSIRYYSMGTEVEVTTHFVGWIKGGATYKEIIDKISKEAYVPADKDETAESIFVSALCSVIKPAGFEDCASEVDITMTIANYCANANIADKATCFDNIRDHVIFLTKQPSQANNFRSVYRNDTGKFINLNLITSNELKPILPATTLDKLLELIKQELKK